MTPVPGSRLSEGSHSSPQAMRKCVYVIKKSECKNHEMCFRLFFIPDISLFPEVVLVLLLYSPCIPLRLTVSCYNSCDQNYRMFLSVYIICIILLGCDIALAWQQQPLSTSTSLDETVQRRRSFINDCSTKISAAMLGSPLLVNLLTLEVAQATTGKDDLIDVYFGCGCVSLR